jgi:hypothetical protein
MIVLSICGGAVSAVWAQTTTTTPGAAPQATGAVRVQDPILARNCQGEYDQAVKKITGVGFSAPPDTAEVTKQEVLLNGALLRKLDCKTDQANRKLDILLNGSTPPHR